MRIISIVVLAAVTACASETADDATTSNAAVTSDDCPNVLAGHDTPETALDLGDFTDGSGTQYRTVQGSIAIGTTVYALVHVHDTTNLRANPYVTFGALSVYQLLGHEDVLDTADMSLDVDVTYTCASDAKTTIRDHAMYSSVDMTIDCPTADDSGTALLRIRRKSIPFPGASDQPKAVARACGLTYVVAGNHEATLFGR
jgi:hypothetical protein